MSTSPLEILELARHIRQSFLTEAGRRSAISRAYYAAMHGSRQVLGSPATQEEDESSHRAIIRAAAECAKAPGPVREHAGKIALSLDYLRRRRNQADYNIAAELDKTECDDCITRAERLLELCAEAQSKLDAHAIKVKPDEPPSRPAPTGGGRTGPGLKRIK